MKEKSMYIKMFFPKTKNLSIFMHLFCSTYTKEKSNLGKYLYFANKLGKLICILTVSYVNRM